MRTYGEVACAGFDGRRYWMVSAEPHVMIRLKRILPRAKQVRSGALMIADTPEICADLTWAFERWPMRMDDKTAGRLRERTERHTATQRTVTGILDGSAPPLDLMQPARTPRPYQVQAADIVLSRGALLLADDVGLGKSFSGLLVLREPAALPALIVTLTHLPRQWMGELEKSLPWLRGHIITSGKPYDLAGRRGNGGRVPDVLVMNYHKLAGWADHLAGAVRTVIFDEAQELRHNGTKKYVAAGQIADGADFKMHLTATPVYNYGGEIHNVINIIAPDALGTRDEFVKEWCGADRFTVDERKVAVKNPAALGTYLRDQGIMLRRTRTEVGRDLDDAIVVPHTVDTDAHVIDQLTGEAAAAMAEQILARRGDSKELFRMAGDFDWRVRHATGVAKAPHVAEFVRMLVETGEQVVLYGWHRDVYDIWLDRLADCRPVLYTGSESPTQKEQSKKLFLDGAARVLVMSLRSGAGLDGLQDVAHVAVFGELDWSPEIHNQCIGRLRRDGQTEPVVAYYLISEEGSDPTVAEVLQVKRQQAEPIRDPSMPVATAAGDTGNRVRMLAEEFLRRRGIEPPAPEPEQHQGDLLASVSS